MNNATDNTTTTTTDKVSYLPFSGKDFIRASMLKSKGSALGIVTFAAYKGLYSQALQGGMRGELSPTSARNDHIVEVYAAKASELTPTGKAFVKIAHEAVNLCKAVGKPKTQDAHDEAILKISALWAGCFKDAAPRTKSTEPTAKQTIASLEAQLHAMVIERDAAMSALTLCREELTLAKQLATA